jgi:hypothetical protein
MVKTQRHESTPLKHMILRLLSLSCGKSIIKLLKKSLIFKQAKSHIYFKRTITLNKDTIIINDEITNLPRNAQVFAAPRSSQRHVASANSFHKQEFHLTQNIISQQSTDHQAATFKSQITYSLTGDL